MAATIGERIAQARAKAGMAQPDLAHRIGVAPMTISKWERGVQQPGAPRVELLSTVLGVSADWLIHGHEGPGVPAEPDPPFFAEFLENYPHVGDLSAQQVDAIRVFARRGGGEITSWTDYVQPADWIRNHRPSKRFEEVRRKERGKR